MPGTIPDVAWHDARVPGGYQRGMAVNLSIGQGDVNVTPMQQVVFYGALATGVLRSSGFGDWHYVAYLDQKTILLARNVASGNRERRIGTIPWITRNPGNITVSQKPEQETGPGPKEAFRQGAYAKGGVTQQDQDTLRYAVFTSVAEGLAAIWPQLVVLNQSNGGKLTLLGAMKIFKGVEANETAAVKDSYVAGIADLLTVALLSALVAAGPTSMP